MPNLLDESKSFRENVEEAAGTKINMSPMTKIPISLRDAAAQNDAVTVMQLIQACAPINEFDGAPLRVALRHKHANIVQILLEAGADCQSYADEFMRIVALHGDAASLQLLINHLKQPTLKPAELDRYLALAITSGDAKSVQVLLDAGANPKPENQEPVKTAASVGSVEILRILQQRGADLCAHNSQPLCNAVTEGHAEAVKFLIGAGANVNAQSPGYTEGGNFIVYSAFFLECALRNGDAEILEILLEAGGKLLQIWDVDGITRKDSMEIILLLERYGHDIELCAYRLAASAIENSAEKILEYVLNNFIFGEKDLDEWLELAANKQSSSYRTFALLLRKGANATRNNSAALKLVIENRKLHVAQLLINANAQVADLGITSVYYVLEEADDWKFFIFLLERGVTMAGLQLDIIRSDDFFIFITPEILLRDGAGKLLPKTIRDERIRFVLDTAKMMKASPNFADLAFGKKGQLGCWIAKLFQEMQASS